MRHYELSDVMARIAHCGRVGCVPLDDHEWFKRLVEQANAAYEAQRRYECAMGQVLAGAVVDIAEAENEQNRS